MTAIREFLLAEAMRFIRAARELDGVTRIAFVGSILTDKPDPKDIDLLVTITDTVDVRTLARLGRRLKGTAQTRNHGADIFLASPNHRYLGRTCSYRECHPRSACQGTRCDGGFVNTDLHIVELATTLVARPGLIVWPRFEAHVPPPADVEDALRQGLGADAV